MTTYLSLTSQSGPTQTLQVPSEDNVVLDLGKDQGGNARKLSFTKALDTPPDTPPRGKSPQPNVKLDTSQDKMPQSTTQAQEPNINKITSPSDGYQDHVATSPTTTYSSQAHALSPATRLKHRLKNTNELIVCPGVYDGLSARVAMAVGFETMYMVSLDNRPSFISSVPIVDTIDRPAPVPPPPNWGWPTSESLPATTWSRTPT